MRSAVRDIRFKPEDPVIGKDPQLAAEGGAGFQIEIGRIQARESAGPPNIPDGIGKVYPQLNSGIPFSLNR